MRNELGLFGKDMEKVAQLDRGVKEFGQWIGKSTRYDAKKSTIKRRCCKVRRWFDDIEKPTFLWNLHFGEILREGGI